MCGDVSIEEKACPRYTVGQGQAYETVQAALSDAAASGAAGAVIHILPGVYKEKLEIRQDGITLEGENPETTVITFDDFAFDSMPDGEKRGTFRSYTLLVNASHVALRNLSIENSAGFQPGNGQCIALYAEGDDILCTNCRLLSGQDTLFTGPLPPKEIQKNGFIGPTQFAPRINGHHFYDRCFICGTVDFIFGSATAYFRDCTIQSIAPGYATAASTPEGQPYGYVFERCRFEGEVPDGSVYLGRPWRDYAKTVILHSWLGPHISPDGWHDWNKELARKEAFYAEYGNEGPGASGERASWTHTLTEDEIAIYDPALMGFPAGGACAAHLAGGER